MPVAEAPAAGGTDDRKPGLAWLFVAVLVADVRFQVWSEHGRKD
jgi:hypothetical protein